MKSARKKVGGHVRVRPFNTRDSYPEQRIENDLCQAVIAGKTIYLRGQVSQDLRTGANIAVGDPGGQARQVLDNIEILLLECGASLQQIVSCHVYLTDIKNRELVYRALGERMHGIFPVFTGVVVTALARPEWLVEVTAIAVLP